MDSTRLSECLATDFRALRAAVAAADPTAPVPSCPDWSVGDLAVHTATVYLHKTECIRLRRDPDPWPPELPDSDPLALLDGSYAGLVAEFAAHRPGDPARTWYGPDQTVGFWIRRMAQETVIHRIDAELAAGLPLSPVPDDLAVDGIDELLDVFLGYGTVTWAAEYAELLAGADGRPLVVRTTDRAWTARTTEEGIRIAAGAAPDAAAEISGDPVPLLLRLWNRADSGVSAQGDPELLARFQALTVASTQ